MNVSVATVISEAYTWLNVTQLGSAVPQPLAALGLSFLKQLIDNWNAERAKVWCDIFQQFTLVPSLNPHTIGPTGATFTVDIRPVSIDDCMLNLNTTTPNDFVRIDLIDGQTYNAISVPDLETSIPTALFYEEDWPNGKLFFYPVPNFAYPVRFRWRTLLSTDLNPNSSLDVPPGYQQAITLTLAEMLATPSGRTVPDKLAGLARDARARIEANNVTIPILDLRDGQQRQPYNDFNWRSRQFNS